jgi:hypothetical protein
MYASRLAKASRWAFALGCSAALLGACSSGNDFSANLDVHVQGANQALGPSEVTLYAARSGADPQVLSQAATSPGGFVTLFFNPPTDPEAVLYIEADQSPEHPVRLMAILGQEPIPDAIMINELTTVAAAYAMAQFVGPNGIAGSSPGLQNAAATSGNLASVESGEVAAVLAASPNGSETTTLATFNSLANLIAACIVSQPNCNSLFSLATPPQAGAPADTFSAVLNIAHFPGQNVASLLQLAQAQSSFSPALAADATLDAWTLALRYVGNGQEIDGPGNVAFDAEGNAWILNNYVYQDSEFDPTGRVCGDDHILRLTPTGEDFPGAPYQGGGIYGAGYGLSFDPLDNLWIGNFGFQGSNCPNDLLELSQTVSKFSIDGVPLSPTSQGSGSGEDHGGFPGAGNTIRQPQGTVSDRDGNIWIANCGGNSVTQFPGGNPDAAFAIAPTEMGNPLLVHPFDVAIDAAGLAWVTSNDNSSVFAFDAQGNTVHSLIGPIAAAAGISRPMGVATDSLGNVWVSNSGIIHLPCQGSTGDLTDAVDESNQPGFQGENASVTMIQSNGQAAGSFQGGGILLPWGIAVDGNDNVWIANFAGQRVSQVCGARPETCPPGLQTGDPISPANGYGFDGLVRNTGVEIDPSGNVWVTNNWQIVPIQQNPGGHEMVVFVGLAKPVKSPLIGPPQAAE